MKPHMVLNSKEKKKNVDVAKAKCCDDQAVASGEDSSEAPCGAVQDHQEHQLEQQLDTELVNLEEVCNDLIQLVENSPENQVINNERSDTVTNAWKVRACLLKVLDENLMEFTKNAREALDITRINLEDRDLLMDQAKRLFVNMILSSYLTSRSNKEQLSWLGMSGEHLSPLIFSDTGQHFATTKLNLFNGDNVMLDLYMAYAESLRQLGLAPCSKNAFIELIRLYPGNLDLSMRQMIIVNFETKTSKLNFKLGDAYDIGQTLEAMSVLLDQDGLAKHLLCHAEQKGPLTDHLIPLRYTVEEEMWLTNTRDQLLSAMMTVPTGSILNGELENMSKYGVVRKDMVRVGNRMMENRLWSSYLSLEQFRDLSYSEQSLLVRSSHKMFCTLVAARVDGRPIEGDNLVLSPQEVASSGKLKKLSTSVVDMNVIFGTLPPEWEQCRRRLHDALSSPDGHMRFFALISLVLFSSTCLPPTGVSSKSRRRFHALKKWLDICLNRRFGGQYEELLYPTFRVVRTMSEMLPSCEYLM